MGAGDDDGGYGLPRFARNDSTPLQLAHDGAPNHAPMAGNIDGGSDGHDEQVIDEIRLYPNRYMR